MCPLPFCFKVMRNPFVYGILSALCVIASGELGYRLGRGSVSTEPIIRDTTIWRTIYRDRPVKLSSHAIETKWFFFPVHDTITISDTVFLRIPVEQKEYGDENYHAWVSGYKPQLDSIHIFQPMRYISNSVTTKVRPRWTIGIQGGYGVYVNDSQARFAPYIGLGVSYDLFSW